MDRDVDDVVSLSQGVVGTFDPQTTTLFLAVQTPEQKEKLIDLCDG